AQGRGRTVIAWVTRMPSEVLSVNPWVAFFGGFAELGGNPKRVIALLGDALEAFDRSGDPVGFWSTWCALVQAHLLVSYDYRPLGPLTELARAKRAMQESFPTPELEARVERSHAMAMVVHAPESPLLDELVERAFAPSHLRDPEELALAA